MADVEAEYVLYNWIGRAYFLTFWKGRSILNHDPLIIYCLVFVNQRLGMSRDMIVNGRVRLLRFGVDMTQVQGH